MKNRTFHIVLVVLAFLVIIGNSLIFANQKNGYFLDETCTFLFANAKVFSLDSVIKYLHGENVDYVINRLDTWLSYEQLIDLFTVKHSGKFNFFNVYIWQALDNHPPFYYAIVNLVSSILPNLELKWIGYLVNTIILLATCLLIYRICLLLMGEDSMLPSISAVLYYGLSYEYSNTVTYYRMYAMLAFWLVLLLYQTIVWLNNDYAATKKDIYCHCVIIICAMLTQYFAVFYIFPIFVLNILFMLRSHKSIKGYIKSITISAVIYLILWPASVFHILFSNRGHDVQSNLLGGKAILQTKEYINRLLIALFSGMKKYMLLVLAIAFIWAIYNIIKHIRDNRKGDLGNSKNYILSAYLLIPMGFYFFVVAALSPWVADRYQTPVIPIICITIIVILYQAFYLVLKNSKIIGVVLVLLSIILCIRWESRFEPQFLYNDYYRNDYIENFKKENAMIIGEKDNIYASEVVLNFSHPKYYLTEKNVDLVNKIDKELATNGSLVMYLNKECDEELIKDIQAKDIHCTKLDYSTDFHDIYYLECN